MDKRLKDAVLLSIAVAVTLTVIVPARVAEYALKMIEESNVS